MKNEKLIIVILAVLLVLFVFSGLSKTMGYGMMYNFYGYGSMLLMWLSVFLLPVALVLLIIWLLKQMRETSRRK